MESHSVAAAFMGPKPACLEARPGHWLLAHVAPMRNEEKSSELTGLTNKMWKAIRVSWNGAIINFIYHLCVVQSILKALLSHLGCCSSEWDMPGHTEALHLLQEFSSKSAALGLGSHPGSPDPMERPHMDRGAQGLCTTTGSLRLRSATWAALLLNPNYTHQWNFHFNVKYT